MRASYFGFNISGRSVIRGEVDDPYDMYPVRNTREIPVIKGQKWTAIFLTPQNYSENGSSATRTDNLGGTPPQTAFSSSLLRDMNTLFLKNISLIRHSEFPVNFEAQSGQTMRIVSNHRGFLAHL